MLSRCFAVVFFAMLASLGRTAERPNVVWIVSEDNSVHYLNHFFPGGAKAPNIEALANHGLTFDHAFSNAPVCSVARTTLATACYGPRIGTQFHRRYQMAPMPEGLKMFPAYLRDAGYYTTNNSKRDYNAVEGDGVWDQSSNKASWQNRNDESQPFFHMQSHGDSHEGSLHFAQSVFENQKNTTELDSVQLSGRFPSTTLFRFTHARYHDRMKAIDRVVGRTIAKLEADGLLEDTFVFYFGDHGGVLPGSKGYANEAGLHVPLVVRVPKNFAHLVDGKMGSRVKGFVNFIDFGPTVLNLAGVDSPKQIDGVPFLGDKTSIDEVNTRDETFGYADRFDEKYDLVRTLRKGKYMYIRNFQPYLPDGLNNNYRYRMLAYVQWRDLSNANKLGETANRFFMAKPTEQLYDCESDPHQLNNLAGNPAHEKTLSNLRGILRNKMLSLPDLSLYPESHLIKNAMDNPVAFGQRNRQQIKELMSIADLALKPFNEVSEELKMALKSNSEMVRFWAATVCASFGDEASSLVEAAKPLLKDESNVVRMRACDFLGRVGVINPQTILTDVVNSTKDPVEATEALNSVVWFRDFFQNRFPVQRSDFNPIAKGADISPRLNYIKGQPYPPKKKKPNKKPKN